MPGLSEMTVVLLIISLAVVCIVTEVIRIDLVAMIAMLLLVWTGSIKPKQALSGFSSNAIIAIIAVMIMGRGLFKSGITDRIAGFILQVAGKGKRRVRATISGVVGLMSGLMQNIGAAALFLPVMVGISKREKIPISNLLLPMGYAALLGGTLTMVGTSSLIVLNDLLESRGMDTFHLFSVTPLGLLLLAGGILYFFVFGEMVLPRGEGGGFTSSPQKSLINVWGLSDTIYTYKIQPDSPLIGKSVEESELGKKFSINLLRLTDETETDYDFWDGVEFKAYQTIVLQGQQEDVERFAEKNKLKLKEEDEKLDQDASRGYIEVVIPARSNLVGKTLREVSLRETYQAQVVLFFSDSEVVEEDMIDRKIKAGDTMVLHGTWENLQFFEESEDFITVSPFESKDKKPEKAEYAVLSFIASIALVFFTNVPISIGFLTGAMAMVLFDVLDIEEAYRSVEWKVVFLIAGLIPMGIAMEESGAAKYLATSLVAMVQNAHPFLVLLAVGGISTFFSLIMSNVAATVLLVPLVLGIARQLHLDGQSLVLLVGVCAANSFVIPTHHVNALLMTPGGYQVSDYIKAGSGLTVLFLFISVSFIYFFYLPGA